MNRFKFILLVLYVGFTLVYAAVPVRAALPYYGHASIKRQFVLKKKEKENQDVAILVNGSTFNRRLKSIGGERVKRIRRVDWEKRQEGSVEISQASSPHVILLWVEGTEAFLATEAQNIEAGEDLSGMFSMLRELEEAEFLSEVDTSKTKRFDQMFFLCRSLNAIHLLDVGHGTEFDQMFYGSGISNLSECESWDVSHMKHAREMFARCSRLKRLEGLSQWEISELKSIEGMFSRCQMLSDLNALSGWNTEGVEVFASCFQADPALMDVSPLSGWNLSSATDLTDLFASCSAKADFRILTSWENTLSDRCMNQKNIFGNSHNIPVWAK